MPASAASSPEKGQSKGYAFGGGEGNLLNRLQTNDGLCHALTGQPCFEAVVALFEYINYSGLFDNLRLLFRHEREQRDHAQERKRKLNSPLAEFIVFLVTFRRFRAMSTMQVAAEMAGLPSDLHSVLYGTWTVAVSKFFDVHMPWPNCEQAAAAVPDELRNFLQIPVGVPVVIGDITSILRAHWTV
eukprot:m.471180 g.471180  ORF g.471180 m.471180 type:complete len:186 (-) comp20373_c0_seq17:1055-1612(-)